MEPILQIKEWCLILIAIVLGFVLLLAFGVYIFFMLQNPDYLRSVSREPGMDGQCDEWGLSEVLRGDVQ